MDIQYKIDFFSDWHCGSGLSAGADVSALVIKDKDGLPFVPGKTIKGLLREAVEDLQQFDNRYQDIIIDELFGFSDNNDKMQNTTLYFRNAELSETQRKAINDNNAAKYLYRIVTSIAIDDNYIAKNNSLRKIEVVVPCTLEGEIIVNSKQDINDLLINGLSYIKRLGQNRNRGLGRCKITIKQGGVL